MDINTVVNSVIDSVVDAKVSHLEKIKQKVSQDNGIRIGDICFIAEDGGRRVKIRSVVGKDNKVNIELINERGKNGDRRECRVDASHVYRTKKEAEDAWKALTVKDGIYIPHHNRVSIDFFSNQLSTTEMEQLFGEDKRRMHHIDVSRVGDYLLYEMDNKCCMKKYISPVDKFTELKDILLKKEEDKEISVLNLKREKCTNPVYLFKLGEDYVDFLTFISAGGVM